MPHIGLLSMVYDVTLVIMIHPARLHCSKHEDATAPDLQQFGANLGVQHEEPDCQGGLMGRWGMLHW